MQKQDMIMEEYKVYTFEDMEVEEAAQVLKANNANLSPAIRRDALDRLEVMEVIKHVFMDVAQKGQSPLGMRFDVAFLISTGKPLDTMTPPSMISTATNTFVSGTDKMASVAVEGVRTGLNKFATWLSNKTQK